MPQASLGSRHLVNKLCEFSLDRTRKKTAVQRPGLGSAAVHLVHLGQQEEKTFYGFVSC